MSKPKLDIVLDAPKKAVFVAGTTLSGKVTLDTPKEIKAKEIVIRLYGTEKALVRYSSAQTPEEALAANLSSSLTTSYRKQNRAKEAMTSGQLEAMKGLDQDEDLPFWQSIVGDFLNDVKAELVAYLTEDEEEDKDLLTYANAAVELINDIRGASKEAGGKEIDYVEYTIKFTKAILPADISERVDDILQLAEDFTKIVTGNAFQINKRPGNCEALKNRRVFEVKIPLDEVSMIQNGRIAPGKYEIPFAIELPDTLPSTLNVVETNGSKCRIEYRVVAELKGSGTFYNYKLKRAFRVRSKPLDQEPKPYTTCTSATVRSVGIFKQGMLAFAAKVEDTLLDREETAVVKVSFRNTSKVHVKTIKATLWQDCDWKAGNYSRLSHTETMKTKLAEVEMHSFDGSLKEPKGTKSKDILKELNKDLEADGSNLHSVSFTMPKDANCTYMGALIAVKHHLTITIKTDSMFTTNPMIEIPIQCGEPQHDENDAKFEGSDAITVPSSAAVVGGVVTENDIEFEFEEEETSGADNEEPSLEVLIKQMEVSVNDLAIVKARVNDPKWDLVFESLTLESFAEIFPHVDYEFELADIGTAVANKMSNFTCDHLACALRSIPSEHSRSLFVEKMLPCCSDVKTNYGLIVKELTEWEEVATQDVLAKYI
jgi:hypothetical protein